MKCFRYVAVTDFFSVFIYKGNMLSLILPHTAPAIFFQTGAEFLSAGYMGQGVLNGQKCIHEIALFGIFDYFLIFLSIPGSNLSIIKGGSIMVMAFLCYGQPPFLTHRIA